MNSDINNIDDLFDDSLSKSLTQLGFLFPKTIADFKRIEQHIKNNRIPQPDRLKDPYVFLNKHLFKGGIQGNENDLNYSENLAQAAREGKEMTDEVKKKMLEDKLKARKKDN